MKPPRRLRRRKKVLMRLRARGRRKKMNAEIAERLGLPPSSQPEEWEDYLDRLPVVDI